MASLEIQHSSETPRQKLDVIIVLGENIKRGWGPKEIKQDHFSLSPYSKANVLAASILYLKGVANTFIFSTGHTAGKETLSEAEAMESYFKNLLMPIMLTANINPHLGQQLNHIISPRIILEEESLNTTENAKEVVKILREMECNDIGLLAPGFHIRRANDRFSEHGIKPKLFMTEDVLGGVLPGIKDQFMTPEMVAQEIRREFILRGVERLPFGKKTTGLAARLTRNPHK